MMNYIWGGMIIISLIAAVFNGRIEEVALAASDGAKAAIDTGIALLGITCLWTGLAKVGERAGMIKGISRLLKPVLSRIFPKLDDEAVKESIVMNYQEAITKIDEKIKNKEFDSAEQDLLQIINDEQIKCIEDDRYIHYSFYNYIETLIYWRKYRPIKKILRPGNNIADAYFLLGFINFETKNYGKAILLDKKMIDAYYNKAQAILAFEDATEEELQEALTNLEKATELDEKFIDAHYYSAVVKKKLGLYESAIVSLNKVLDLQPESPYSKALKKLILTKYLHIEDK